MLIFIGRYVDVGRYIDIDIRSPLVFFTFKISVS